MTNCHALKLTAADGKADSETVVATYTIKDPTDVESVQTSEVGAQKILRDGQVLIIRNGETYDLNGKKVE